MSDLGALSAVGLLSSGNRITAGCWVVTFLPQAMPSQDFEVWHGAAIGPGGYFLNYIDDTLYGVGENGRINEYAPPAAMYVRKGQTLTYHWSIATGAAPQVWLRFRQPEVGRL